PHPLGYGGGPPVSAEPHVLARDSLLVPRQGLALHPAVHQGLVPDRVDVRTLLPVLPDPAPGLHGVPLVFRQRAVRVHRAWPRPLRQLPLGGPPHAPDPRFVLALVRREEATLLLESHTLRPGALPLEREWGRSAGSLPGQRTPADRDAGPGLALGPSPKHPVRFPIPRARRPARSRSDSARGTGRVGDRRRVGRLSG